MEVAIMGAGLSGLACALELERQGFQPVIFEQRDSVGDRFVNGEVLLNVFSRPVTDEIAYLAEHHKIFLKPTANIKDLYIHSPKATAHIEGHLGFSNIRGRHHNSWEQQLAAQLETPITFNSTATYEDLLTKYSHVVVATGDAAYAQRISQFDVSTRAALVGATVEGDFSRYSVHAWLNNSFAPHGYGYLIPFSEQEANIVIAFPVDDEEVDKDYGERLWRQFHRKVQTQLNQSLRVTDQFQVYNYLIGVCRTPRVGNTFLTGNCLGALSPWLGFGQFASLLSGVFAAWDIAGKGNYTDLTAPILQSHRNALVLRRFLERLDNEDYDVIVTKLDGFWGEYLFTTQRDVLKWLSYVLRLWLRVRQT